MTAAAAGALAPETGAGVEVGVGDGAEQVGRRDADPKIGLLERQVPEVKARVVHGPEQSGEAQKSKEPVKLSGLQVAL